MVQAYILGRLFPVESLALGKHCLGGILSAACGIQESSAEIIPRNIFDMTRKANASPNLVLPANITLLYKGFDYA